MSKDIEIRHLTKEYRSHVKGLGDISYFCNIPCHNFSRNM